jgi:hypothetical protein
MYHGNLIRVLLTAVAMSVLALLGAGQAAAAASLRVCSDASKCYTSIQGAIDAASEGDKVMIAAGTYQGSLSIGKSLTLRGAGASETTITQAGSASVITIDSGVSVTIKGVTVTGGYALTCTIPPGGSPLDAIASGAGGGINNSGTLTLAESAVHRNRGWLGGGIYNAGAATLYHITVSENLEANCGTPSDFDKGGNGIYNVGTITLNESTVSGNSAYLGGGIYNTGIATLKGSSVSGNGTWYGAGGIANRGTVTLMNSTVTGNDAIYVAGGIYNFDQATLILRNSAVSSNRVTGGNGGGIYNEGTASLYKSSVTSNHLVFYGSGGGIYNLGTLTLRDSTVSGNIPDDCFGC